MKQQKNYPKTLTDMYGLMVDFEPTRSSLVSGGRNKGMNFGNVAAKPGTEGDGDHVCFSTTARRLSVGGVGGMT